MTSQSEKRKSLFLPGETNSERRLRREASKWLDTLEQPRELSFFERLGDIVDIPVAPFVPTEPRGFGKTGGDFLGFIPGTLTPRFSEEKETLAPRTFFGRDPLTPAQRRAAIESELQASLLPSGPRFEQRETPGKFSLRERVEGFQELPVQTQLASGLLFDLPLLGPTDIALRGLFAGARGAGRFARTGRAADIFGPRGVRELEDIGRLPATAAEKQAKARRSFALRAEAETGEPYGKSLVPAGAADGEPPTLPSGLTRAKPKYGKINLTFDDDLDRASYIIADQTKKSKSDAAYLKFVQDNTGLNVTAARARGAEVRARIKELARAAGPDVDTLTVPRTAAAADVLTAPVARGAEVSPAAVTPDVPEGRDIVDRLFASFARGDENRRLREEFVSQRLRPVFRERFGDDPVMEIRQRQGEEPLLSVSTAGWRERVEQLGFEYVDSPGFVDRYRIPGLPAVQAATDVPVTPAAARGAAEADVTPVQMTLEELPATQRVLPSETEVIPPVGDGPPTPPPGGGKFPPDEPPMQSPAESGNMALGDLRELSDVMDEVVTLDIDNPVMSFLSNVTGINPSILRNTTIGRAVTAFARQLIAADSLADVGIAALLRTQLRGAAEQLPMRITADGLYGDTGVPWNQVFANPSKYDLSDVELAFITAYNRLPVEVKNLRAAHGLPDLGTVSDEFYVPRQVSEIRGAALSQPSNPKYRRLYEDAEAGFANGIRYNADPIATMRLHITSAYREIALKQLDDAVSQFAIKPRKLISKKIADSANEAAVVLRNAKRDLRNAIQAANGEELVERIGKEQATAQEEAGLAPAVSKVQQKLRRARAKRRKELEQAVSDARENLETATRDFNVERAKYKAALAEARNSEVAPGYLWHNDAPTIKVGEWHNNFFPLEDADLLNEAAGRLRRGDPSSAWKAFEKTANTIRFLASVGDFAAPFIQGLPILARNPEAWGRATLAHYQAWFDVGVQSRYIRDNIEVFQEMAAHGIPIGDVEFFRALQPGGGFSAGALIERLPQGAATREILNAMGRQSFGRFQSSYNTFLTMGRGELWKSMKPTFRGSDAELAAVIRNMTGGLDTRALGVGPSRRSAEGMWLAFSPRLLRSTVSMVADLRHGTTTVRGVEAWRTIGSLVGGATSLYIITGVALGKSEEEIRRGLNPLSGKDFLSHEINGDLVGIGGQIRSMMQLGAGISSAIVPGGKPMTDLIQFNRWENPMMQFWMFRGAPALNIALGTMEATSGANIDPFRNIQSTPDLLYHIGFSALPFSLQGALEGEKPITTALALSGMRTSVLREQGGASFTGPPRPSTLRPGVSTGVRGSIPTAPVNRLMQPESSGQRPTVPASRLMQPGS